MAGGIPLIRALRESLRGEPIRRVLGIVNGTTNYILTKMTEEGADYGDALAEAQRLGYAERDPTADVEGFDAGAKAAIIATHRLRRPGRGRRRLPRGHQPHHRRRHRRRPPPRLRRQAAGHRRAATPAAATVAVRVHPAMVPAHHPLASVRDSYNAVFVEGDAVGSLMFYGRGAGGMPDGQRRARRPDRRRRQPAQGHPRLARHVRPGADPRRSTRRRPSTTSSLEVRRPARRAPRRHRRVRPPRREHPRRGAGGPRRRRPAGVHHPRGAGGRRAGHAARAARPRRGASGSAASCASIGA